MRFKKILKKIARVILNSSDTKITVEVDQVKFGEILKNRNIVITGGGKGIGYAIAEKCISEGANVVISGRNINDLKEAQKKLGKNCSYIVFDNTDINGINTFLEECDSKLNGKIDSLICNAGISLHEQNFRKVTIETFDKAFNTNFKANYFLAKYFIELIEKKKKVYGNLIFISSETGNQCYDIPYGLTKSSINSLTGALSRRVYKNNIRVNAIAPGVTISQMTKDYADCSDGNLYRKSASDRIFLPEEIAEVACFLLSNSSKCISGEVIHCNAGNHLSVYWDE